MKETKVEPSDDKTKDSEDKLLSSVVRVMEPNGNVGKNNNAIFNFSNGTTINFQANPPVNNNNKPRKSSLTNGAYSKTPLDRMSSVASSQYTTANSVLKLVTDDASVQYSASKKCFAYCKRKWKIILLLFVMIAVIAALATLYVLETQKKQTNKTSKNIHPCFRRATAKRIENITNQPEIINAIKKSRKEITDLFKKYQFKALSLNVNYMGEKIFDQNLLKSVVTGDTPFPIASISKIFTVLMLHILNQNGTIKSLDDNVEEYEPLFKYKNPFNSKRITFRHLACMMSGLPRETPCLPFEYHNFCPHSNEEMFHRIQNISLIYSPGKVYSYSNMGMTILGRVMERLLPKNQTFEEWIIENIVKPLNMTNTGFDILNRKDIPVSQESGIKFNITSWGWLAPTGGMYSSTNDLAKLGNFLTGSSESKILSKKVINRILHPEFVFPDKDKLTFGCPFETSAVTLTGSENVDYQVLDKHGGAIGYSSVTSIIPELKLNVNVVMSLYGNTAAILKNNIMNHFTKALDSILKSKTDKYKLPSNPEYYVGTYKLNSYWPLINKPCTITLKGKWLFFSIDFLRTPLTATSEKFVLRNGNFYNTSCYLKSIGLLRMELFFDPPTTKSKTKAGGFYINGITTFGYVEFKRIG